MPYEPTEWKPGKSGGTKITAARLNNIEQGVNTAISEIENRLSAATLESTYGSDNETPVVVDTTVFPRYVLVLTGNEARPGATGGLVFYMDMRIDTSTQPASMEPQDVRMYPGVAPETEAPTISTTALNALRVGVAFSQQLTVDGVPTPTVTATGLPTGLTISTSGLITGTPTTAGSNSIVVTATNSAGNGQKTYNVSVGEEVNDGQTFTIFGDADPTPYVLDSYSDAGLDAWMAQQFYVTSSPPRNGVWEVAGIRIFIPVGSSLIGRTAEVSYQRQAADAGSVYVLDAPFWMRSGGALKTSAPLAAGWNETMFDLNLPINSLDGVLLGYCISGQGYLFSANRTAEDPIRSVDDINLYLASRNNGITGNERTYVHFDGQDKLNNTSSASFYGIDIIVREV